jgi:hypothetical protein
LAGFRIKMEHTMTKIEKLKQVSRTAQDLLIEWESTMVGRHIEAGLLLRDGSRPSLPALLRERRGS